MRLNNGLPLVEVDTPILVGVEECPKPCIRWDLPTGIALILLFSRDGGQVYLGAFEEVPCAPLNGLMHLEGQIRLIISDVSRRSWTLHKDHLLLSLARLRGTSTKIIPGPKYWGARYERHELA
jgi:hypothetical protein